MIGHLKGTLVAKQPPGLTLDVAGVGYEIEAPMSTFYRLPETGEQLTLLTHFLVRDDAQLLYGFATEAERSLFRNLLKVSGVGARIALGILSGISAEGFRRSVFERDLVTLTRIPGIGRKTAERLILEMTDRLEPPGTDAPETVEGATQAEGEARSALLALGYRPAEVGRMFKNLDTSAMSSEQLIREALKRVHSS
ncbi:MAG: Holliday junction branch migration protein RuvA [Rhodospirillaceae bacterium]|nr:Holliday junction branch migration protein RuvA [Rhodospirillaceae bacterium]